METNTGKYISLDEILEYLSENHNHIDDVAVVIDSIAFEKWCKKNAKEIKVQE